MKITEIKTFLMQVGARPTAVDMGTSRGGDGHGGSRNWLFVKVLTDEGVYGVGEGSGWPAVVERGPSRRQTGTSSMRSDPNESQVTRPCATRSERFASR